MKLKHRSMTALAAAALVALAGLGIGSAAQALPPDGPGAESKGTSSRVWPTTVKAGDTLNFEVSGYPANETVYIKIDDGNMCTDSSHGACVYAMQKLDGKGSGQGSIVVPKLSKGGHWLRMLATGDVFDKKTGKKIGYKGYTRRGGNDFTVVGGGANAPTVDDSTTQKVDDGLGSAFSGDGGGGGGAAVEENVESGELKIDVGDEKTKKEVAAEQQEAEDTGTSVEAGAVQQASAQSSQIPWVGIGVLGGAVLLGAVGIAWALMRRKKLAGAAGAAGAAAGAPSPDDAP